MRRFPPASRHPVRSLLAGFAVAFLLSGCIPSVEDARPSRFVWTWVGGTINSSVAGNYGTQGVTAATNIPAGTNVSNGWVDNAGALWIFGGTGPDTAGVVGDLNYLWKFDGANWTWVKGAGANTGGIYGTQGVAAAGNTPGTRQALHSWKDASGNLWLFGGQGYDAVPALGYLSDLWKFDGTNWTWMHGPSSGNFAGTYGTPGVAAPGNNPGARFEGAFGSDGSGNFWLFGGYGYDSTLTLGNLNDLWKFDGTSWIWVSGSTTANAAGVYGSQGVAAPGNVPGGRSESRGWVDPSGNFWVFGGTGYDSSGSLVILNDLWKFDGTNWTWVKGPTLGNSVDVYGTQGVASPANTPGPRMYSTVWTDAEGNLWLFGGWNALTTAVYNSLWRFDGADWTWEGGANSPNNPGSCGTKGVPDFNNIPSATTGSGFAVEPSGAVWMFNGTGTACDGTGPGSNLDTLWLWAPL